jgi:uncharacterized protein YbaR (Trm112 family)
MRLLCYVGQSYDQRSHHMSTPPEHPFTQPNSNLPMDSKLLELLVCPVTKGALDYVRKPAGNDASPAIEELVSRSARLAYPVRDGIPVLLENEARQMTPEEVEQMPARTPLV